MLRNATSNCTDVHIPGHKINVIYITKMAVCSAAILMCAAAIVVIVALKDYKIFVYRLVLYVMVAALLDAFTLILELLPIDLPGEDKVCVEDKYIAMCAISGFLSQVAVWIYVLLICWIVLYLVLLAVFKYNVNADHHRQEVMGLCIVLVLPFTFNWAPFLHNMYGLSGLWCWIKTVSEQCDRHVGLFYQIALFYGPLSLVAIFGFFSFTSICVVLFREACRQGTGLGIISDDIPHVRALRGSLPLVAYPLLFSLIFSVMLANRIYISVAVHAGCQSSYPLWLAHAIADPLFTLFPPLAFIFHPSTLKKLCTSFRRQNPVTVSTQADTTYIVSREFSSSDEPLIVRGEERAPTPRHPYYSNF